MADQNFPIKKVYLNEAERIADERKQNRNDETRGEILPFRKDEEGLHWALPKFITDIIDDVKLPGQTLQGYQPTPEDTTQFALDLGMGGAAGSVSGAIPEGAVGTFSGGKPTFHAPMYPEREIEQFAPAGVVETVKDMSEDSDWWNSLSASKKYKEGQDLYFSSSSTHFHSPLSDALDAMDLPAKGKNITKDLREKTNIRKSDLDQYPMYKLSPDQKYDRNDLRDVFDSNEPLTYSTSSGRSEYEAYQRQPLDDDEVDYGEFPIQHSQHGGGDIKPFKANSQHYDSNTLAHVRLSLRQPKQLNEDLGDFVDDPMDNPNWNVPDDVANDDTPVPLTEDKYHPTDPENAYVLVEELQSDLLQHGYKPAESKIKDIKQHVEDRFKHIFNNEFRNNFGDIGEKAYRYSVYNTLYHEGYNEFGPLAEELEDSLNGLTHLQTINLRPLYNAGERVADSISKELQTGGPVPISSTTDSVRLGIQQAIAYARKKGVNKIVLPPLERIVRTRTNDPELIEKYSKPGGAFYNTYIAATNKVLEQLVKESGGKIKISNRELPYKPDIPNHDDLMDHTQEIYYDLLNTWVAEHPDYDPIHGQYQIPESIYEELRDQADMTARQRLEKQKQNKSLPTQGVEIDISGMKDKDLSRPRFAKGGMVMSDNSTEGITSNAIPPGGKPSDVADDVPIMASEGEYVIPANVVRYIGLDKIEKMVSDAKVALADMEGKDNEEPELPFDPSELMGVDNMPPVKMAKGGEVKGTEAVGINDKDTNSFTGIKQFKNADGQIMYVPFMYGEPQSPIPPGYVDTSITPEVTSKAPNPNANVSTGGANNPTVADRYSGNDGGHDPAKGEAQQASPLAGDPKDWSFNDFMNFQKSKGSVGERAIKGMISMIPGGGLAMKARQSYLDKATADLVDGMLQNKVDPQGNPLGQDQLLMLSKTREDMKNQMSDHTGLNLNPLNTLGEAFQKFSDFLGGQARQASIPNSSGNGNVGKPAAGTNMLEQQYNGGGNSSNGTNASTGGSYGVGSDMGRSPSQGPSSGQMASGGLYAKGGLVKRRR
jgi:hypothetical protein